MIAIDSHKEKEQYPKNKYVFYLQTIDQMHCEFELSLSLFSLFLYFILSWRRTPEIWPRDWLYPAVVMCRAGSQGVGFARDHVRPGMDEDQSVALAGTEEANVAATTIALKILYSL